MASPSGVEPETRPSQGLMISYFTTGINLDAGPGIEPGSGAYETPELPLLYRAAIYMAPRRGFDPLTSTVTVSRSPN